MAILTGWDPSLKMLSRISYNFCAIGLVFYLYESAIKCDICNVCIMGIKWVGFVIILVWINYRYIELMID